MTRFVKQLLFASLIACHAAVVLCGPCLHELPGASHQMGAASKPNRSDHPLQSPTDSKDSCLICHFVAQGQLPVEFSQGPTVQLIAEVVVATPSVVHTSSRALPSCPRAPPVSFAGLS